MRTYARSPRSLPHEPTPVLPGFYQGIVVISSTDHAISVWVYNHGNENAIWRFSLHSRSAQILIRWVAHERGFLVSGEFWKLVMGIGKYVRTSYGRDCCGAKANRRCSNEGVVDDPQSAMANETKSHKCASLGDPFTRYPAGLKQSI